MSVFSELCARLKALTFSPALPVAWPDTYFTPPTDGKFLEVIYLTNPTQTISMDNEGVQHETGIFQVNIFWPAGKGKVEALAIAEQIKTQFKKGTTLASGARMDRPPWVGGSISAFLTRREYLPLDGKYSITPVSIPWAK